MLRVCMAQINTTVGDLEGNTRRICEAIDRSRDLGTDLICFPELSVPGYPPEDLLLKPDFVRGNLAALEEVTRRTTGVAVVVGFVDQGTDLYNAAAVCVDGERVGIYHKQRLPNYGVFDEKRYFHPGRRAPVFIIEGVPVGVTICEDSWAPGGACQAEAAAGALVIININGSPYHAGKWRERAQMLATRARDYGVALCYNNLVGGQDELVFDGMSMIFDHTGAWLARGTQFEEDLVYCDVDPEAVRRHRLFAPVRPAEDDEGPVETYTLHVSAARSRPRPSLRPSIAEPLDPSEEIYRALVLGTRDYMRKNGFSDATQYGDMAGGFAVIKDVPKTLVYDLARWRNGKKAVIPDGVLTRAPTAELRAGQKDTDTLPPYEMLDPILKLYVEEDTPPADIVAAGYPADIVRRVIAMVDRNEYKRRQAPPGVKITPKAFGKDRRLPITNWYRSTFAGGTEARLDGR